MGITSLFLLLLSTFGLSTDVEQRPLETTNSRVLVTTPGTPASGYFLIGSVDNDSVGMIDNAGVLLSTRQTGPATNITPTPYGGFTYYQASLRKYVVLNALLQPIDTFGVEPPYTTDFHEGYQARGRRYIVLGTEERSIDMSALVAHGRYDAVVIGAVLQEFDRYGRKTFEWKSLDHISPLEATPDVELTSKRIDYIHVNSIVEDNDRNFLLSCRNIDQVIKIDRVTGEVMWRFGGSAAARSDFTFVNDDNSGFRGFSHQHSAIRARNGDLILFDNGNLRPIPFSRAVAYRLDEQAKSATKTWEYIPTEMQISPTMGSVQELANGNILIGWGSTPTGLIATEVDREGTVHSDITTHTLFQTPYRVRMAVIALTASTRTIDTLGRIAFNNADSTTRVSMIVSTHHATSKVTVEKHNYEAHNQQFSAEPPCIMIPLRWVIRGADTTRVNGEIYFDLSRILGDLSVEDVDVFFRDTENEGLFTAIPSAPIDGTDTRMVKSIRSGEYVVAAQYYSQPILRVPNNNSVVGASVMMEWTQALGADGYEVELSEDPSFTNETQLYRTQHNDTTLTGLSHGLTYYWRVRVVREPEVGPWTLPWSFTTPVVSSTDEEAPRQPVTLQGTTLFVDQEINPHRLELYTITGECVLSVGYPHQVDVSHIPGGCYAVVLTTSFGKKQRSIIMR